MTTPNLGAEVRVVKWRGSELMEWAKSAHSSGPVTLHRSAVPQIHDLKEIPGGPFSFKIEGSNFFGHPELRARLASLYEARPEEVLIAQGASQCNYLLAGALLQEGGEAVVETPVYQPALRGIETWAERVHRLPRRAENAYLPDPDDLKKIVTTKTKLLWLTNLHNPTHREIEPQLVADLVKVAQSVGAPVIIDEVYLPFVKFDFRAHGFTYGAISVNSLDKSFGLDSLRVGWAIAPKTIVERAYRLNNLMGVNQPFVTEDIANQVLRSERAMEWFRLRISNASAGVQLLQQFAKSTPQVELIQPCGGVNACVRLPLGTDDREFVESLHAETGVMVFPGSLFEMPGHIRVSFGSDAVMVKQSFSKLREFIMERFA